METFQSNSKNTLTYIPLKHQIMKLQRIGTKRTAQILRKSSTQFNLFCVRQIQKGVMTHRI